MKIKKFDSINVIPFIDVLLVLLAIVLMTSTFIAKGVIQVSLPKAKTSVKREIVKENQIFIKNDNNIYLENQHVSLKELRIKLKELDRQSHILINSDKDAKIDSFVSVLDILKQNSFDNVSIVTKK